MGVDFPYYRTYRMFSDGDYESGSRAQYTGHPSFASSPENYIRAAKLIIADLEHLFEYIEPSDVNLSTYSYRIHELHVRTCIEIEANFKAILLENDYVKKNGNYLNFKDYAIIEKTHFLSSYKAIFPYWTGEKAVRSPFKNFSSENLPTWFKSYNQIKHDRMEQFIQSNLENLTDAISALAIVLAAQFGSNSFQKGPVLLALYSTDNYEASPMGYIRIEFPSSIPEQERYCFDWNAIREMPNPFQPLFSKNK